MTEMKGRCLCGAVEVTLTAPRDHVEACHCDMCRRWGGVAFVGLAGESFDIGGRDAVTVYKSSNWAERAFCSKCGSNLWYRYVPGDHYAFLAGLFDGADGLTMKQEIFIDEKPGYYSFAGDRERLTGAETMAKFGVDTSASS